MKTLTTPLLAIVIAAVVIGMVTIGIQQVTAPRGCSGCVLFKKLTHEFEKNVISTIKDESAGPIPHLRELLTAYTDDVNRIFLGGPDTIPPLIQNYERDVTTIFDQNPPEPDKQVKDFRSLTHDFEKAVIGAVNPPEPDTPA